MSHFSKHCLLFLVAALAGGGVAFKVGAEGDSSRSRTLSRSQLASRPGSQNQDGPSSGLKSPALPPPSSKPSPPGEPKTIGAMPPGAASVTTASTATHTGGMLTLLHSLKAASNKDPNSQEEKSRSSLKAALEQLLKHLRQSELARSVISRRDTEGYISTFVKIAPPTIAEIHHLKQMLAELQAGLSPGHRVQFQNESLLLFRQFVFAQDKSLVVFITEHFAHSPAKTGNFHSHLTSKPDQFWHHHNREPIGTPPGETTLEGGVLTNPVAPTFRYYHLANNR